MVERAREAGDPGREASGTQAVDRFPLLRYYLVASLIIIAVLTVIVAFLFVQEAEDSFEERSTTRGAMEASHLVQLFYFDIWAPVQQAQPDITLQDTIEPETLEAFARRSTLGLNVEHLSILDLEGTALWSNHPQIIGARTRDIDSHSTAVNLGTFSSKLHINPVITRPDGTERRSDNDIVMTFYPIRDAPLDAARESKIVGVLEIGHNVTEELSDARGDSLESAIKGSVGMGAILFALLLLIIFRADRIIGQGHKRLLGQQEELLAAQAETIQLNESLDRRVNERTAELVQSQVELAQTRDQALEATRAKTDFLANMSHELRTPLNAIIGYSEMLQEQAEDEGQEEFVPDLQKVHGAGKHLLELINDVLDLSKIEAGRMDLYLETFDLSELVKDTVAVIGSLVGKNANTLEVHCDQSIGSMQADMTKVRQTLFNLLSNASKFTEGGTISLDVPPETQDGLVLSQPNCWQDRDGEA